MKPRYGPSSVLLMNIFFSLIGSNIQLLTIEAFDVM